MICLNERRRGCRLTEHRLLAAMALVVGLPFSARAQDVIIPPTEPPSSLRMRMGPLDAAPSLLTSNGYDTNVTRVGGTPPISSYEFFSIPQLDVRYRANTFAVTGVLAAEYAYTPGEVTASKKSNLNNYEEVGLHWGETIIRPTLFAWRRNTYARPDYEIGKKSQRIAKTVDAGVDVVPGGRLHFSGGFVVDRTRYDADEVFNGIPLAEKLNFDVFTPRVRAAFKLTPMIEVGGGLELPSERFLLAPERDGDGSRSYGMVTIAMPPRLFGNLYIGVRRFTPTVTPDESFSGTYVRGGLGYQYNRSYLITTINRDLGFSYDSGRGFFVATTILANYRRTLPRRFEVEVEALAQKLNYHPVVEEQVPVTNMYRYDFLGALGFNIKPWIKIGGNIERENATGAEYWNAWRFTFYTTYGSNRFRKLDRPLPR